MKNTMYIFKLNADELTTITGGTGPLGETGPIGYPYGDPY